MKHFRSNLSLVLAALIWGAAFLAQQESTRYIGSFTFNSIRFLIGGIVLLPVIFIFSKRTPDDTAECTVSPERCPAPNTKKIPASAYAVAGITCGCVLAIASSFQQIGFSYNTTAGKAAFITALYVIIVPVIERIRGRKTSFFLWISVIMAILGMGMLTLTDENGISFGDVLEIMCAVMFSVHIIVVDRVSGGLNGVLLSCIQFFTAGILCGAVALFTEELSLQSIWECRWCILYAGVFSCGVAYTLQIIGQKKTKPVIASLLLSLESVFAALLENLFTLFGLYSGNIMSPFEIAGCIIVFLAIILAQLSGFRKRGASNN